MNLKLSDWANIAEIASSIAVAVTLIILILSIRDDTGATRTLVYEELMTSLNDFQNVILQDDQLTSLWLERGRPDSDARDLTEIEQGKLLIMFQTLMRILDSAFSASQYETIGQSQADRLLESACLNYSFYQMRNREVEGRMPVLVSDEFQAYLESCPPVQLPFTTD